MSNYEFTTELERYVESDDDYEYIEVTVECSVYYEPAEPSVGYMTDSVEVCVEKVTTNGLDIELSDEEEQTLSEEGEAKYRSGE